MGKLSELLRQLFEWRMKSAKANAAADAGYRTIIIAAIVSAVGVFYVVVNGAIGTLNFITNDWLDIAMSWFVPAQTPICIAALITARVGRSILDYHLEILKAATTAGGKGW